MNNKDGMIRTDKIYAIVIIICAVLSIISLIMERLDFICLFMGIGTTALYIWPEDSNKYEHKTGDSSKA